MYHILPKLILRQNLVPFPAFSDNKVQRKPGSLRFRGHFVPAAGKPVLQAQSFCLRSDFTLKRYRILPERLFLKEMVQTHCQTRRSAPFVPGSSLRLPAEQEDLRQQPAGLHPFVPSSSLRLPAERYSFSCSLQARAPLFRASSRRLPAKQASPSHRVRSTRPAIDSEPMWCYDRASDAERILILFLSSRRR